jgi:hypothetical protein
MNRLAKKAKKDLVVTVQQFKATVIEHPVIAPVQVRDTVLPDVACGVRVAVVSRWQALEIVEAGEKLRLLQATSPGDLLDLKGVKNVATCDPTNSHDRYVALGHLRGC